MKVTLNQLIDNKGLSQNQIAKDTGISVSTLRNLNHNRTTRISFDVLEKLCIYLDCGVEDILCIEKNNGFPCFYTRKNAKNFIVLLSRCP